MIFYRVEEFGTISSVQQCFKCQGLGKSAPKFYRKQICCVWPRSNSHPNCPPPPPPKKKKKIDRLIVRNLIMPPTKVVLLTRSKPSGNMCCNKRFHMHQCFSTSSKQHTKMPRSRYTGQRSVLISSFLAATPTAPFVFYSSTLVERKKAPAIKASTVLIQLHHPQTLA